MNVFVLNEIDSIIVDMEAYVDNIYFKIFPSHGMLIKEITIYTTLFIFFLIMHLDNIVKTVIVTIMYFVFIYILLVYHMWFVDYNYNVYVREKGIINI